MRTTTPCRAGWSALELLVTVAVLAVLAAILIPVLGIVRGQVRRTVCAANLRQIGVGSAAYALENRGTLMRCWAWDHGGGGSLLPYLEAANRSSGVINGCPEFRLANYAGDMWVPDGYAYNPFLAFESRGAQHNYFDIATPTCWGYAPRDWRLGEIFSPGQRMLIADGGDFFVGNNFGNNVSARHRGEFKANRVMRIAGVANVLFLDGRVAALAPAQAYTAIQDPARLE